MDHTDVRAVFSVVEGSLVKCVLSRAGFGREARHNDLTQNAWPDWFDPSRRVDGLQHTLGWLPKLDILTYERLASGSEITLTLGRRYRDKTSPIKIGDLVSPLFSYRPSRDLLYPFQQSGVDWLLDNDACILADDMGLGKTVQVIATIRELVRGGSLRSCLVLCPKALVANWANEIGDWANELVVWSIAQANDFNEATWRYAQRISHVQIVNYDALKQMVAWKRPIKVELAICDEGHRLRNATSQLHLAFQEVGWKRCWMLTGTPIERDEEDLVTLMRILRPDEFARADEFVMFSVIRRKAAPYILRRTKSDALSHLPKVNEIDMSVHLQARQRARYEKVRLGLEKKHDSTLAVFNELRQICDFDPETQESAKADKIMEILDRVRMCGEKAIVFSYLLEPLRILQDRLVDRYGRQATKILEGSVSIQERQHTVQRFQENESPWVLLLSTGVGREGLTLTRANHAVFFNLWWNPSANAQARDRIVRIGQHKECYIYKLIVADSVESRLQEILEKKSELAHEIIGRLSSSASLPSQEGQLLIEELLQD